MVHTKKHRLSGLIAAAGLLLAQLGTLPAQAAATPTAKDISTCDVVCTFEGGKTVTQAKGVDLSCAALGVPAGATVSEVWIDISMDTSSHLPAMPAMGYTCLGYVNAEGEQTDWYGDGMWMNEAFAHTTLVFNIPEEAPMPDQFGVQLWGEEGTVVDTMTLNAIGFVTGGGGDIGMVTRKGDVNNDKTVDINDVTALQEFLTHGSSNNLKTAANGDLEHNNKLNAKDFTLLKRGILNGSFNQTSSKDETAMEFVNNIKIGWNLGNSLEAQSVTWPQNTVSGAETSWGNPLTTKAMIDAIKDAGFNTVRVPVSWGQKMDNSTYEIKKAWMDRVQEVVNYVIDNDMYCILNIHHDNDIANYPFFYPSNQYYNQSERFVTSVWQQVSDRFEAYDNHLIFETLNEPRLIGHDNEWWINPSNKDCTEAMENINKLNAAALNVIRKSGGNNTKRFVMMPTYSASPDAANLNGMKMPDDDHLIAEIHAYRPYHFALAGPNDSPVSVWDPSTGGEVISFLNDLKSRFLNNGIPVIIDEFGARDRDGNADERAKWIKYYLETTSSYGIPCVYWDNNAFSGEGENFGLLDRNTLTIRYPQILSGMMEGVASRG
ncbi:MAG: cellulase family glycosylhydrolase [Oscillospiraceae bacterium]|nr:cellulase family glycosylhydrolase [Oscillospiraceae bacterium]